MVVSCCIIDCTSRFDKNEPKKFYRIPKKPADRRNKWVKAIRRNDLNGKQWEPSDHDRVCFRHFISGEKSNDIDNPDYIPTLNLGYKTRCTNVNRCQGRRQRIEKRVEEKNRREVASVLLDLSFLENLPRDAETDVEPDTQEDNSLHDKCLRTIAELRLEAQQTRCELERLQLENQRLNTQIEEQNVEKTVMKTDKHVLFYTGLPTKAVFLWILNYCVSVLPACKVLSPNSVLLLILMKLRLNLQHQDLAYRFNISQTTVSDIINQSLPKLADKLSFLIQWPDRETIVRTMPQVIKDSYPRCCSIIDCFEIFINRPGQLTVRAQTWSNYKSSNTIKFLVSITPTGAISFLSKGFGGRTSDKVITQRSGYLEKLEHGDQVLADRGFLISEDLANHNATLVIPAFTRGKTQLSAKEVEQTRKLAHVRIHVERAIQRLKNFNILSGTMSIHMVPHADNIVTICSSICNLQPKLVS